jgi:hypothetical protein
VASRAYYPAGHPFFSLSTICDYCPARLDVTGPPFRGSLTVLLSTWALLHAGGVHIVLLVRLIESVCGACCLCGWCVQGLPVTCTVLFPSR